MPLFFARDEDRILIHGSTGAGLLRHLVSGMPATLTVFQLDAVVIADSTFDSSANYRSAVLRGHLAEVPVENKDDALRALADKLIPGRTQEVRPSLSKELAATTVLSLSIEDGKWLYKSRTGPSGKPTDAADGVWVGVVPFQLIAQEPQRDDWVDPRVAVPASVEALHNRHQPH